MSDAKPFLKWAGGKRQLLPELRRFYPPTFGAYYEPFAGSAAVFLDLHNQGALGPARLSDRSVDLVGCYIAIRDHVGAVVAHLEQLADAHARRGKAQYYEVRNERFNPLRRRVLARGADAARTYPAALAAMLIYLNRTGYNGLFRLNSHGDFNVPAGRYDRPKICDADNLRRVSAALRRPGIRIDWGPFDAMLASAQARDFVYLDPPYAPLSRTASFTSYTAAGFTAGDQQRLQAVVVDLARRGCHVVLSNSTAPEIQRLYADDHAARTAGLKALTVPARRAINSRGAGRGAVLEYVITNVGVN
jgi:DNA adenine methylase